MPFPEMSLTETVVFRAPYRQIESYDTVRHKFGIVGIAMSLASLCAAFLTVDAAKQAALPES